MHDYNLVFTDCQKLHLLAGRVREAICAIVSSIEVAEKLEAYYRAVEHSQDALGTFPECDSTHVVVSNLKSYHQMCLDQLKRCKSISVLVRHLQFLCTYWNFGILSLRQRYIR